jgi:hypothetical protein
MTAIEYGIEYIAVKNLSVIWVQAQRPFNEKWAKEIADNFDPDKFDPVIVTKPNGQGVYHIVEGQHRRHALEMFASKFPGGKAAEEKCPCRIVDEADPKRAAEIWLGINAGRKAVKPITGFEVGVVAKREPEVTINRIVQNNGFKVSSAKSPFCISAVGALRTIYNRHSDSTLAHSLQALKLLWGGDPQAVSSPMLRGFAIFLNEFYDHVDARRLQRQIGERFTPWKFKESAEIRKHSSQEKLDEAISELIIREYNRGAREGVKLKHKS